MAVEDGESDRAAGATSEETIAVAGLRADKSHREVAVALYGRERVDACWHADNWMRAKVRRLLYRAEARSGGRPNGAAPGTA